MERTIRTTVRTTLSPVTTRRLILVTGLVWLWASAASPTFAGWKAGTARVAITPAQPMWMAGYAARNKPSAGAVHDLWAKALALEDPSGRRVILITLDLCGIDRDLSNRVRDAIHSRQHLGRAEIVLACSHTHSAPVTGRNLLTMYPLDETQRRLVSQYAEFLHDAVIELAGKACERLADAQIGWGTGRCDFAVNRRNNREADVPGLRKRSRSSVPTTTTFRCCGSTARMGRYSPS